MAESSAAVTALQYQQIAKNILAHVVGLPLPYPELGIGPGTPARPTSVDALKWMRAANETLSSQAPVPPPYPAPAPAAPTQDTGVTIKVGAAEARPAGVAPAPAPSPVTPAPPAAPVTPAPVEAPVVPSPIMAGPPKMGAEAPRSGFSSFGSQRLAGLEGGGAVYAGPQMLHVGEREPKDGSGYAPDEYVYADPGVGGKIVVAPRKEGEAPTLKNAVKAIRKQEMVGRKMYDAKYGGSVKGYPVKAQGGVGIYQGGDYLTQLLQMLTGPAGVAAMTELPLAQLAIMQALGFVNPQAIGVTDPAEFRNLLSQGGSPTLQALAQQFQQGLATRQQEQAELSGAQQFGLQQRSQGFQEEMGRGRLGLDTEMGRRDIALREADMAFQRSIRGLKGLPAVGNTGALPTFGSSGF